MKKILLLFCSLNILEDIFLQTKKHAITLGAEVKVLR